MYSDRLQSIFSHCAYNWPVFTNFLMTEFLLQCYTASGRFEMDPSDLQVKRTLLSTDQNDK
jgi:hypothetical protein